MNKSLILWIFTLSMIEYLFMFTMISLTIASEYYGLYTNNRIIYRLVCVLESDVFPYINLVIGLNMLSLFYYQGSTTHNKMNLPTYSSQGISNLSQPIYTITSRVLSSKILSTIRGEEIHLVDEHQKLLISSFT